jgi:hypothetical protein
MKKLGLLLILLATSAANAQQLNLLQPGYVATESLRLSCARADVGRGVGRCTERTILHVYNAPRKLSAAQYECSVTWELEKDAGKIDFADIVSRVEVPLRNGNGRTSFETERYVGAATDPVRRIVRSRARCIPLDY